MTSSTKVEVRNILHCSQSEDRAMATVNMYRKFREVWRYVLRYASRQAGRHTNTLIALFYIPTRGGE